MPIGTISSSPDTVGVAVVNYEVPVLESRDEVLRNCENIAQMMWGIKRGFPGLDLVIFPEYSTQGFHPTKWMDLTTTVDGPEVEIFAQACVENKVWGIFSLTGEHNPNGGTPFNSLLLIDDRGEVVLNHHKVLPWVPMEPWYPGDTTTVGEGPKGMKVGLVICYEGNHPEIFRDTVMKGAELVVRCQGYMYPSKDQQRVVQQCRAWENLTYVAVANMAGRDLVYSYFGHSMIVDFDGRVLAECETTPNEVTYALLSLSAVRDARRNWTAENHLFNTLHRGYTAMPPEGVQECPFDFYKLWVNDPQKAKELVQELTRDTAIPTFPVPVEV